jgi:hypothetical protein
MGGFLLCFSFGLDHDTCWEHLERTHYSLCLVQATTAVHEHDIDADGRLLREMGFTSSLDFDLC